MEWNWNGNRVEILPQKKSMLSGIDMEWKWNGNFTKKLLQIGLGMNGIGMEINGHPDMEVKLNGMKWKRKGN